MTSRVVTPTSARRGRCVIAAAHVPSAREGADVHFVDDVLVTERRAGPVTIGPLKPSPIDNLGRAERSLGLVARRRIGRRPCRQLVPIALAGPCRRDVQGEEALILRHRDRLAFVENQRHFRLRRRPHAKPHTGIMDNGAKPRFSHESCPGSRRTSASRRLRQLRTPVASTLEQSQDGAFIRRQSRALSGDGWRACRQGCHPRRPRARRMDVTRATDGRRIAKMAGHLLDRAQHHAPGLAIELPRVASRSAAAASSVPAHVRKSFAVNSAPVAARR